MVALALWIVVTVLFYDNFSNIFDGPLKNAAANSYRQTAAELGSFADYARLLENVEYSVVLPGTSNVSMTGPIITAGEKYYSATNFSSGMKTACNFSVFENASHGSLVVKSVSGQCYSTAREESP